MPGWLRNTIAVIVGVVVGGAVNLGLITLGSALIPAPPGVDVTDPNSIAQAMALFGPQHFLFPFLAHALGTLSGALLAALLAASRKRLLAMVIGVVYLLGGIMAATMIPAPLWFLILDLTLAYLPMGWLGGWLGSRLAVRQQASA